jgi:transposase
MVEHMVEPSRTVRRLEVITTAGGRRRWSQAERGRILAEAMAPGAVVSVVARRNGMSPQHLFTWLREARRPLTACGRAPAFVPVLLDEPASASTAPPLRADIRPRGSPAVGIEVELAGAVVRIGADANQAQIAAVIRALKSPL